MSVASLPMYDLGEIQAATDAWWAGLARAFRQEGVEDVPAALVHDRPLRKLWSDPDLFLSQCCGFDIVKSYTRMLRPVATPRYSAPGCDGCHYVSVVVVRDDCSATDIEGLREAVCAVNGPESHSGMNAMRALVAPYNRNGRFFSQVKETGAHAESLAMVACGEADVAAIDCVTYGLLAHHRPGAVAGMRVLCFTETAPGVPYVTRTDVDDETVARLQTALARAFDDPDLEAARDQLFLAGIEVLPHSVYDDLVDFERRAVEHGYPELR